MAKTIQIIEKEKGGASKSMHVHTDNPLQRAKQILEDAASKQATDVHIRVFRNNGTRILYRIHGDLIFQAEGSYSNGIELIRACNQGDVSGEAKVVSDKSMLPPGLQGFRVVPHTHTEGMLAIINLLYCENLESCDIDGLGYGKRNTNSIKVMMDRPSGLNIIAGPAGSGKSTTLHRVLHDIYRERQGEKHIVAVEERPIGLALDGAIQIPVRFSAPELRGNDHQSTIMEAMRLDPEIIMVDEIRDESSAMLVLQASMMGHQAWIALRANSAMTILSRLIYMGMPRDMVYDPTIISGLVCQRLIKLSCPHCKVRFQDAMHLYSSQQVNMIMRIMDISNVHVTNKSGCQHCNGTGIAGRTAVTETVIPDEKWMSYLRSGDRLTAFEHWKTYQGGKTMLEHTIEKISTGLVDPFAAQETIGLLSWGEAERDGIIEQCEIEESMRY